MNSNFFTRRVFLAGASSALGACGLGLAAVPFLQALKPTRDIVASGVMEVDVSDVPEGSMRTVLWRRQPVLVLHRTQKMVDATARVDPSSLVDPAAPEERVKRPDWLVCLGVCTHLGCIPSLQEQLPGMEQPGLLCPCHGGMYDTLGRRIAGPPPVNLFLLPYEFVSDEKLRIGSESFSGFAAGVRKIKDLPAG